jgi:endonuclease YncB( thermonuclease family)
LYKTHDVVYLSKIDRDNFGRSLSTVTFIDENNKTKDLAHLLLLKGYAVFYDDTACAEKKKAYLEAQQYAMDNKLGLFSFEEVCFPANFRKREKSCDW